MSTGVPAWKSGWWTASPVSRSLEKMPSPKVGGIHLIQRHVVDVDRFGRPAAMDAHGGGPLPARFPQRRARENGFASPFRVFPTATCQLAGTSRAVFACRSTRPGRCRTSRDAVSGSFRSPFRGRNVQAVRRLPPTPSDWKCAHSFHTRPLWVLLESRIVRRNGSAVPHCSLFATEVPGDVPERDVFPHPQFIRTIFFPPSHHARAFGKREGERPGGAIGKSARGCASDCQAQRMVCHYSKVIPFTLR